MVWLFLLPPLPDLLTLCSPTHSLCSSDSSSSLFPTAPRYAAGRTYCSRAAPAIWSSIPIAQCLIEFEEKQGVSLGKRHCLTLPYDSSKCGVCREN